MKKLMFLAAVLGLVVSANADMAAYINAGVSNLNPTIGLNAEFQYGYASFALGAGVMAYNDFGYGVGLRGYLFGIDGGPYAEVIYGTSGEKANTHLDANDKEIVDSVEVYHGISALLGWRLFFADGWNMTFGAGAAQAAGKGLFVFNVTAGIMLWGDEAADKNAEKYKRSYEPPEPGSEYVEPEMPDEGGETEEDTPIPDMMTGPEQVTASAGTVTEMPVPETGTAAPAGTTGTAAPAAVTGEAGTK